MVVIKDTTFAQRFEAALDYAGIAGGRDRRSAVARMFNVSIESARKWTCGESIPQTKRLALIARELNVNGEWLLSGRGSMTEPAKGMTSPGLDKSSRELLEIWRLLPHSAQVHFRLLMKSYVPSEKKIHPSEIKFTARKGKIRQVK